MANLRKVVKTALVLMLLGALVAPAAVAKQPDKQVPLKGDFVGVLADFSGNFSHLGRFEGLADFDHIHGHVDGGERRHRHQHDDGLCDRLWR